jgi:glycosyltransferase involved in cell wall biosynthesis
VEKEMSLVRAITRKATRLSNEPLNIVTCCTHESYESELSKTGHNFYAWRVLDGSVKDWDSTYRPLPGNYHLLNPHKKDRQIPEWLDIDLVLSQNKFGQFQILKKIADFYKVPLISLEHTLVMEQWTPDILKSLKKMSGDINVFISEYSRKAWGWSDNEAVVVHHGIDADVFKPNPNIEKKRQILSVVNDFINRDYFCGFKFWQKATQGLPVKPIGKTPGLSSPAKNVEELTQFYNESQIFINTSLVSPIPTALLEAMSSGTACVSTSTAMIPEIIENGINGIMTNDPMEMRHHLIQLLEHPERCQKLGENARKTVQEKFSVKRFINNWNNIFYEAVK